MLPTSGALQLNDLGRGERASEHLTEMSVFIVRKARAFLAMIVEQVPEPLALRFPLQGLHALVGTPARFGGARFRKEFGLVRKHMFGHEDFKALLEVASVAGKLRQHQRAPSPIFSRFTTTPAFSRSQVSSVTPTARSFTFSILAVGVRGSASTNSDEARDHEMGETRPEEFDQLSGVECFAGFQRDDRHHFVLRDLVSDSDGGRFAYGGMSEDLGFDLEGRNVLAAAADRVLQAIDKIEVAFGVAPEAVAGVEPTISPRGRRRLGVAGIAMRHRPGTIGSHHELADLAELHFTIVFVDDANFHARARLAGAAQRGRVGRRDNRPAKSRSC